MTFFTKYLLIKNIWFKNSYLKNKLESNDKLYLMRVMLKIFNIKIN